MSYTKLYKALERKHNEDMSTLLPKLLNKHGGPTHTAKALGISRTAMYNWMNQAGVARKICYTPKTK